MLEDSGDRDEEDDQDLHSSSENHGEEFLTTNDVIGATMSGPTSEQHALNRRSSQYTEESLFPPDFLPTPMPLLEGGLPSTDGTPTHTRKKRQLVQSIQQSYVSQQDGKLHSRRQSTHSAQQEAPKQAYYTSFHYKLLPPKNCSHIKSIRNLLIPLRTIRRPSRDMRNLLKEGEHSLDSIMQRFSHDSHLEENHFHYSKSHVEKRNAVLTHPDILLHISQFWKRLSVDDSYIEKTVHFFFWKCCYDVLIREGYNEHVDSGRRIIIDEIDELEAIEADFEHDRKEDSNGVRYEWFYLSLFELADNWIFSTSPSGYVAFLSALYVRIFNSQRGLGGVNDDDLLSWNKGRKRRRKERKSRPTSPNSAFDSFTNSDADSEDEARNSLGRSLQGVSGKFGESLKLSTGVLHVTNLTKSLTPISPFDEYESSRDYPPFPVASLSPEEKNEELKRAVQQSTKFEHRAQAEESKISPLNRMLNQKPIAKTDLWRANSGVLTLPVPSLSKTKQSSLTSVVETSELVTESLHEESNTKGVLFRDLDDRQSEVAGGDSPDAKKCAIGKGSDSMQSESLRGSVQRIDTTPTPWNTQQKHSNLLTASIHDNTRRKRPSKRQAPKNKQVERGHMLSPTRRNLKQRPIQREKKRSKRENRQSSTQSKSPANILLSSKVRTSSSLLVPPSLRALENVSPLRRFSPRKIAAQDAVEYRSQAVARSCAHPVAFQDTDDLNVILAHLRRTEPMITRVRPQKGPSPKKRNLNTGLINNSVMTPYTGTGKGMLNVVERNRLQEEIYKNNKAVRNFSHNMIVSADQ
mmetsp:Transcript_5727/g.21697  ORF Transcript_5727/g.21697 Transcript_5727/m.21697 type:complete len:804 (-) Transcript_5727:201-2612(-)